MSTWSEADEHKLMFAILKDATISPDWNRIAADMGRTVEAVR